MRRSTLTWTVVGYHPLACRDLAYNAERSWMWELDVCIRFGSQSLVMYGLEQRLSPLAEAAELHRSSAATPRTRFAILYPPMPPQNAAARLNYFLYGGSSGVLSQTFS